MATWRYEISLQVIMPTRTTDTSSSLLDVILATQPERFCITKNLQLGISDHDMVVTIRKWKLPTLIRGKTVPWMTLKLFRL